jgi:hypothetical protein
VNDDVADDEPQLDRQQRPASSRPQPPQRVPETQPPLLGDWFIYLSVVVLVSGVVAITALELGASLTDSIVRVPALLASGVVILLAGDALVRVWRSAWAWLPVDRGRGLFRFVWAAVLAAILLGSVAALVALLTL